MRRAGVSAFGFGGTNFHAVLEEYIPHRLNGNGKRSMVVSELPADHERAIHEVQKMFHDFYPFSLFLQELRYGERW